MAKYNVITVTNLITGDRYVGARKGDHNDWRARTNSAARGNVYFQDIVNSVRIYGDENHVYKTFRANLSKAKALAAKARMIANDMKRVQTLNMAA